MNVHKIISKSSYKNDEAHTEMINPTSYNDAGADTPIYKFSITVPQKWPQRPTKRYLVDKKNQRLGHLSSHFAAPSNSSPNSFRRTRNHDVDPRIIVYS